MGKGNEPAYPALFEPSGLMSPVIGLTKREYFAGLIYAQFLNGAVLPPGFDAAEQLAFAAKRACEATDALLTALERSHDGG